MTIDPEPRPAAGGETNAEVPRRLPDFDRRLVSILGLPFDAVTLAEAVARVRAAAFSNRRCFVSTPNLNFTIMARRDAGFRGSVLHSDLSLVDGMPLVWIARLLRLPVPMRVAGSELFEALVAHPPPAIGVYFFGGPPGAAAAASARINAQGGGVRCVGFDAAGKGTIESMSSPEHIARINRSGAHFVVVSLGARKGQAWIEANAARLQAPVVSHLGAVVNFAAGSVRRAPGWMQRSGLEWLWRVKEEPALWKRYGGDGMTAARLLIAHVLPDALLSSGGTAAATAAANVEVVKGHDLTLRLSGDWSSSAGALRPALTAHATTERKVTVDLGRAIGIGNELIALLAIAQGWFGSRGGFELSNVTSDVSTVFRRRLVGYLLPDGSR